ncbi:MAG: tetratricopeptide repeat protein [Treponema sp.]|jgi:tetratricopeptide (TPR) repeat protein|nr:tetratricopeptide repeat protein [Treponema sp.]
MPSLEALAKFRASFRSIGNETTVLAQQKLPIEDIDLPESEPVSMSPKPSKPEKPASDFSSSDFSNDDFDFGDFSDLLPSDLDNLSHLDEIPIADENSMSNNLPEDLNILAPEPGSAETADNLLDDLHIPDADLPVIEEDPDSASIDNLLDDLHIPDADELSDPDEPDNLTIDNPPEAPTVPDGEVPLDSAPDSAPADEPEEEIPLDPAAIPADSSPEAAQEPGVETSEEAVNFPQEEDLFNMNIQFPDIGDVDAADNEAEGTSIDSFDAFKMEEGPGGFEDELGKYALEGFDDDLALFSKPSDDNDIEEIQLSNEELNRLQKTIAGYPLNLRIACEQIIAEEAVDPTLMSKFVKSLAQGASMREAASLAGKILERSIPIPKGFEKKTGEALEAEHASFVYIFIHKFLPVLRLFILVALVAASLFYLIHRFVYTPLYADSIYKKGYERIEAGDYARANERFNEALKLHRQKEWFYRYAEGFSDKRQYIAAREKYDLLLLNYPRDKKGVMDYAAMETSLSNFRKADSLLRRNILDYKVDDKEALLAVGDNGLAWGDMEPEQYEVARQAYARLLERYGWTSPVVERMMRYFIRTDNLKEVLPLQHYFMDDPSNKITPAGLAELGGYLLDKKFEDLPGVPNEYISRIDGIRDILIKAVNAEPAQPEPHYHLARYYNYFKNPTDERITLENAIKFFDVSPEESVRRLNMRIDAEQRYAQLLINHKEFFNAEDHLLKGISLYEDALNRRIMSRSPQFGKLYADMGDLEYFTKDGNMGTALEYYVRAEQNNWAPPEMQYRMGSAYYHQGQWAAALQRFVAASADMPLNRKLLNALGNASYMRGNYAIAEGYYSQLLEQLNADRSRFSVLLPHDREDHMELAERLMTVRNNFGVTLEALTERTGNSIYRSQAMGLYSDSARTWDTITRDQKTMIRMRPGDLTGGPSINLGYLNGQNALHPSSDYERQIYVEIDKDVLEPSPWENLTPQNFRLSDGLF